jgi:hypothetical protein
MKLLYRYCSSQTPFVSVFAFSHFLASIKSSLTEQAGASITNLSSNFNQKLNQKQKSLQFQRFATCISSRKI